MRHKMLGLVVLIVLLVPALVQAGTTPAGAISLAIIAAQDSRRPPGPDTLAPEDKLLRPRHQRVPDEPEAGSVVPRPNLGDLDIKTASRPEIAEIEHALREMGRAPRDKERGVRGSHRWQHICRCRGGPVCLRGRGAAVGRHRHLGPDRTICRWQDTRHA